MIKTVRQSETDGLYHQDAASRNRRRAYTFTLDSIGDQEAKVGLQPSRRLGVCIRNGQMLDPLGQHRVRTAVANDAPPLEKGQQGFGEDVFIRLRRFERLPA